jgi:hypothetical protein
MPPMQSYLTLHGFLRTLYLRVRLTSRYLELLLDCCCNEFAIQQPDVQKDWAGNVEALRWLAGPIYRLTAAFRAKCGAANAHMQQELRRQEGRLKAFHGFLLDVHQAYKPDEPVLTDEQHLRQRHQHLRISLNFLIDACNVWLKDITGFEDVASDSHHQQVWREDSFVTLWDSLTSIDDVPPDFEDLDLQIRNVNDLANTLRTCPDDRLRKSLVLALCMATRRLLLVLVFHLLTVRPSASKQLKAAQDALAAAEFAAGCQQGLTPNDHVQTSIQLLSKRYHILVQLTDAEKDGSCLEKLQHTCFPKLAQTCTA